MVLEGHITHQTIQAFEGKVAVPKTPLKVNEHSGKESTMALAFSAQNWGTPARVLTERVKERKVAEIALIIEEARNAAITLCPTVHEGGSSTAATESGDRYRRYANICKSDYAAAMFANFCRCIYIFRIPCSRPSTALAMHPHAFFFSVILWSRYPFRPCCVVITTPISFTQLALLSATSRIPLLAAVTVFFACEIPARYPPFFVCATCTLVKYLPFTYRMAAGVLWRHTY